MKDKFVPYELALKLKELGFNEDCLAFYEIFQNSWNSYSSWTGITEINEEETSKLYLTLNELESYYKNIIKAPLWQEVFDWFRDKHQLYSTIRPFNKGKSSFFTIVSESEDYTSGSKELSYQEARLACLEKLIELCKN